MVKPNSGIRDALIVWVISYVFFLLTLSDNLSASHDSINYLNHIVRGEHLFHQHHLLYHYTANQWLHFLKFFFPSTRAHYLVESFTAIWGSGILSACYLFFRNRFLLSRSLSFAGIFPLAVSYGIWFYSVNVEVYTPSVFFILVSLYILSRGEQKKNDIWLISVLHCLAILFHQVNILFAAVVLYQIYKTKRWSDALKYITTGAVIVGGIYFIAGWVVEKQNSFELFSDWVLGYAVGHNYWQPLTFSTPFRVIAGFARTFIGGHFVFQLPQADNYLQSAFASHSLKDEIYLSRQITPVWSWALTILSIFVAVVIMSMVYRFVRSFRSLKPHAHVVYPLLLTFAVYFLFFVFWMPEIPDFWILQMIIIWLLTIGTLPLVRFPFGIPARTGLILLSMMLFVINYSGSMKWVSDRGNDWHYQELRKLPQVSVNDVIIVEDEWILKDYARYFTWATVLANDEPAFSREDAGKKVRDAVKKNGKAYLYDGKALQWKVIQSY